MLLLAEAGIENPRRLAAGYHPALIQAVVERYHEKVAAGEDVRPGWIVWRLAQGGPVSAERPVVSRRDPVIDMLEQRYAEGLRRREDRA